MPAEFGIQAFGIKDFSFFFSGIRQGGLGLENNTQGDCVAAWWFQVRSETHTFKSHLQNIQRASNNITKDWKKFLEEGIGVCFPHKVFSPWKLARVFPKCVLSCSVMSNSLWPHGLQPTRLLCPWDFPDKNPGVGCRFLFKRIFLTQGYKGSQKWRPPLRKSVQVANNSSQCEEKKKLLNI